jgi:hypothetical protein
MNGIASFSSMEQLPVLRKQQKLSCRTSSVIALSGLAFGGHDLQILRFLTFFFFCGGFLKESTAITQEAQRTLNIALNGLLPTPSTNS